MKKLLQAISFLGIVGMFLISTSCTKEVSFNTLRPAEINVPAHVKSILVVDRTEFKNKAIGIVEGVLTGEGINEDKNGSQEALTSFQQTMLNSPRFEVKRATERLIGNGILGAFPEPLHFSDIEKLCTKYKADAVVALEIFDTNFLVTDGKRNVKKVEEQNGQKKEIEVVEFFAQGIGSVKIGFRIYDPKLKTVADQQMFSKTNTWEGKGSTIRDAMTALIAKAEATRYVSRLAGNDYAYKIAPMPVRLSRTFYSKSKKNQQMASGVRKAEVNQWEEAIQTWKSGLDRADAKTARRMSYNIAVAYEVIGDLAKAKHWANRSYVEYGNKQARTYASQLDYRVRDEDIVKTQMQ